MPTDGREEAGMLLVAQLSSSDDRDSSPSQQPLY